MSRGPVSGAFLGGPAVAQPHVAGPVERTQDQAPGAAVRFSTWFLSLSLATGNARCGDASLCWG